ncbi:MAG: class I SAM-dependent methyltransferase [Candidatus Peribacteraceae bacterium]
MSNVSCCRSCGSGELSRILNIGETPLANALLAESDLNKEEKKYPLVLLWCPACTLLQISENVPGDILFSHYVYQSSFSDAFLSHCKTLSSQITREQKLNDASLVIDIASNDGYLLQFYKEQNIPVLGIEPATNIAAIATKKGIETKNVFFTEAVAKTLPKADVVHAHNVLPHVGNQRDFVRGIKQLLKPDGVAVIEFAYAVDTIEHVEFDQIYHEHMCYFSLTAFDALVKAADLSVVRVEKVVVHGGSLRVFLKHTSAPIDASVTMMLKQEEEWGVGSIDTYQSFATKTHALRTSLVDLLQKLKLKGKRIAAYGASAKGCTLMHFCGIGKDVIDYVVDRSTTKQGLYTPGTHLKIEPVEKLVEDRPDYVLLLTWNFAEEILKQQKEYREQGGAFIVPVPSPKIV